MVSKVDLHIHTSASDGRFSSGEIVRRAAQSGLTVIAITDHDTVAGVVPALKAAEDFPGLTVIPGVEISTEVSGGEVHILGYFIDYTDGEFCTELERFRNSREERARKMVARLRGMGIYIDWDRVQEIAGSGSLGRPHIARAMLEKGYINSIPEAFKGYIERGGPAYVEREKTTPVEAVAKILRAKGLPVLAHPFTFDNPQALVAELKSAGLVGIETYYDGYTAEEINSLLELARRYELIATGGSDYHGLDTMVEILPGGVAVPFESAERLLELARKRGLKLAL